MLLQLLRAFSYDDFAVAAAGEKATTYGTLLRLRALLT
jgi:hypothetical protein